MVFIEKQSISIKMLVVTYYYISRLQFLYKIWIRPIFIISILSHIKHIIHAPYSTESKAIYFIQILSITIFRFFLMRNNAKLITPSRTINRIIKFKLILLSHPPANLWSITLESNFMMINAKSVTVIVTILLV